MGTIPAAVELIAELQRVRPRTEFMTLVIDRLEQKRRQLITQLCWPPPLLPPPRDAHPIGHLGTHLKTFDSFLARALDVSGLYHAHKQRSRNSFYLPAITSSHRPRVYQHL